MTDFPELLLNEGSGYEGECGTDQDWDEHETNHTVIVIVKSSEDDGIREEEGVEHSIDEYNIHAHEVEDWFGEDHSYRPDQACANDVPDIQFDLFLLGDDVGVSHHDPKLSCTSLQDHGCVGLRYQADNNQNNSGKSHVNPEEQVQTMGADIYPATDYGSKYWTAIGSSGKVSNGHTTLLDVPDISNGSTSQRQTRA